MYKNTDEFIKNLYKTFKKRIKYDDLIGKPSNVGNADTVDGFHASQTPIPNGVVVRDSEKYICSDTPCDESIVPNQIIVTTENDTKYRKISLNRYKLHFGTIGSWVSYVYTSYSASSSNSYAKLFTVRGDYMYNRMGCFYIHTNIGDFRKVYFNVKSNITLKMTPNIRQSNSNYLKNITIYAVKTAENVYDIYAHIEPRGANTTFFIEGFRNYYHDNSIELHSNQFPVYSLPSGYITATEVDDL